MTGSFALPIEPERPDPEAQSIDKEMCVTKVKRVVKHVWYTVIGLLPAYGAYNGSQLYGDLWSGLIDGLILAAILYGVGEALFLVARKIRRRS